MRARSRCPGGFTLIELLVVTLILAGVATAIGACVAAGVRVLDSARGFSRLEARAQLGLALLERDVKNSFPFYAIAFEGDGTALAFPGLVESSDGHAAGRRIGTLSYEWDRGRRAFVRRRWRFPPAERPYEVHGEDVIADVSGLRLSYMSRPGGSGEGEWASTWQSVSNHPVSVRVELDLDNGRRSLTMSRVIRPRGGGRDG